MPRTSHGNEASTPPETDTPSRVVGIGASAGGLEAVSELLRNLPNNTGMTFVFIQHLEPRQTSRLTEILSRITDMPVAVASDRLRMKRNHFYVMPPGVDISLADGQLILEPRTDSAGRHLPIDYFFILWLRPKAARQSRSFFPAWDTMVPPGLNPSRSKEEQRLPRTSRQPNIARCRLPPWIPAISIS